MIDKDAIVAEARELQRKYFPGINKAGACFYSTICLLKVLKQRTKLNAQLQAGSLSWRFVAKELDDGIMATHYTYKWSPTELHSILSMVEGNLPEMHVWAGLVETQEIIDTTTYTLESRVNASLDKKWTAIKPPDYFWDSCAELEKFDAYYEPNIDAMRYVYSILENLI